MTRVVVLAAVLALLVAQPTWALNLKRLTETCNQNVYNTCKANGGGNACLAKSGCTAQQVGAPAAASNSAPAPPSASSSNALQPSNSDSNQGTSSSDTPSSDAPSNSDSNSDNNSGTSSNSQSASSGGNCNIQAYRSCANSGGGNACYAKSGCSAQQVAAAGSSASNGKVQAAWISRYNIKDGPAIWDSQDLLNQHVAKLKSEGVNRLYVAAWTGVRAYWKSTVLPCYMRAASASVQNPDFSSCVPASTQQNTGSSEQNSGTEPNSDVPNAVPAPAPTSSFLEVENAAYEPKPARDNIGMVLQAVTAAGGGIEVFAWFEYGSTRCSPPAKGGEDMCSAEPFARMAKDLGWGKGPNPANTAQTLDITAVVGHVKLWMHIGNPAVVLFMSRLAADVVAANPGLAGVQYDDHIGWPCHEIPGHVCNNNLAKFSEVSYNLMSQIKTAIGDKKLSLAPHKDGDTVHAMPYKRLLSAGIIAEVVPQLYVANMGQFQPTLTAWLAKLGEPLTSKVIAGVKCDGDNLADNKPADVQAMMKHTLSKNIAGGSLWYSRCFYHTGNTRIFPPYQ